MSDTAALPDDVPCIHPYPIDDRETWSRLAADPRHALWREHVLAISPEIPRLPALSQGSDFLAAKRFNDRRRVDNVWQNARRQFDALILRRCLLGIGGGDGSAGPDADGDDDRLLDWLWGFMTQPTWCVSAHLKGVEIPELREPMLDLAACEMAARGADALVLLGPWMRSISDWLSDSIVYELDRKVFTPFAERCEAGSPPHWMSPERESLNNWAGVCCGSLLAAACSMERIGQPRPLVKKHAITGLRAFINRSFTKHGECDEGLGYWAYGMTYACIGWSRLSRPELAEALDLPRLKQVADYPRLAHLFGDRFYVGNDAPPTLLPALSYVPWLAAVTQQPWLARWAWSQQATVNASTRYFGIGGLAPLVNAIAAIEQAPEPLPRLPEGGWTNKYLPDQQAWMARNDQLLVTFAGGDNAENHNHNDLGHVNVFVGEEPVLVDPGNIEYPTDFFGPRRYEYLAASSRGHNVPLINRVAQRPGHETRAKVLDGPDARHFELDLTAAYPDEAKLSAWRRRVELGDGEVLVRDVLTLDGSGTIELRWWSSIEPQTAGASVRVGPLTITPESTGKITILRERGGDHLFREYPGDTPIFCTCVTYHVKGDAQLVTRMTSA